MPANNLNSYLGSQNFNPYNIYSYNSLSPNFNNLFGSNTSTYRYISNNNNYNQIQYQTNNDPIADMKNQIKNMDSIIQNLQQKEKSNSLLIKSLQQENYNNKTAIINLQQENLNMNENIINLQQENKRLDKDIKKIKSENSNFEKELTNLNNHIDQIDKIIKDIQERLDLNGKKENELNSQLNNINKIIKDILNNEIESMKEILNTKIDRLIKENDKLREILKKLEKKVNELQAIIIGRKLIKILIKMIIKNCFIDFKIRSNSKGVLEIYDPLFKIGNYSQMVKVVNNLIEIITTTNGIIHIIEDINKSITIINKDTKFEEILKICESSLDNFKKNDIELIKNLLIEKSLLDANFYQELIGKNEKLNNLLLELIKKK